MTGYIGPSLWGWIKLPFVLLNLWLLTPLKELWLKFWRIKDE